MVAIPICPIVYIATSATLETIISKYRDSIDRLINTCQNSLDRTTTIIDDVHKNNEWINGEVRLISIWRGSVSAMIDEFVSGDDLIFNIEEIVESTKQAIVLLTSLEEACDAYIKHEADI